MKIRAGFVSNSSSSSFIVAFPRPPQSVGEVLDMMFGPNPPALLGYYNETFSTLEIATTVWKDIQAQTAQLPLSRTRIVDELHSAAYIEIYDIVQYAQRRGEIPTPWDGTKPIEQRRREEAEVAAYEAKLLEPIVYNMLQKITADPDATIYCFTYADEDGAYGAAMEHGNIFARLPHKQISNH